MIFYSLEKIIAEQRVWCVEPCRGHFLSLTSEVTIPSG